MRQLIDFGSGHSVNPFIIRKVYPRVSVVAIEVDQVRVETVRAIINREWHRILSRATTKVASSGDFKMETSTTIFKL
jgi:tRNA1(Val) A37 N6-methylase TrmN6